MTEMHSILVVDDEKQNRALLAELLKEDHQIFLAKNGVQALERAREHLPDLIMLDVLMPEMDGYQVIGELKADTSTRDIPVIFISALDSAGDEEKGLALGAVDYISKPFHPSIVRARVRNHLSLRDALNQLRTQKQALEEAAVLRDDVERIMHHDLKSPLNGILVATHMLLSEGEPEEGEAAELLKLIEKSGYTMLEMISRSLDLYKMEQGLYRFAPQPVDLIPVIKRVIDDNAALLRTLRLAVALRLDGREVDGAAFMVPGDATLCYSLLANLAKNAMEASPEHGSVAIELQRDASGFSVAIRNQGAVPEEIREHFFDKYATAGKSSGTGLGTYSARLMIQTMGGDIAFTSSAEQGTSVTVRFPPFSGDFAELNA